MTKLIADPYLGIVSLALTLEVVITLQPIQGVAFTLFSQRETISPAVSAIAQYVPPKGIGAPSTVGGGTRGGKCEQDQNISGVPLTALMPNLKPEEGLFALTVETNPEFFFYVPQTHARLAEFVLKDENGKDIYRVNLPITGSPEIASFRLPKNAVSLEKNQNYQWYFVIVCPQRNRRQFLTVEGWTRRVEISTILASQLQSKNLRDRSKIYAQAGIWHEALATLAEERRNNPNDPLLTSEWKKLLESAGLAEIADLPFAPTRLEGLP